MWLTRLMLGAAARAVARLEQHSDGIVVANISRCQAGTGDLAWILAKLFGHCSAGRERAPDAPKSYDPAL